MFYLGNFLKFIAVKSFRDGLVKTNELGKKLVAKKHIERFLDTGCHDGGLTLEFAEILKPKEIYGLELIDELCGQAKRKGIKCNQLDLNTKWNYDDNFFDLILSSQVIEHLYNTRLYLEECYRCLKPKGKLLVLTENLASWVNIFSLLFGFQPFPTTSINGWKLGNPVTLYLNGPKDKESVEEWCAGSHVRVLAYRGLIDLLKKIGFKNIKMYTKGYPPFYGKLSDLLCFVDKRHGHFLISLAEK